MISNLHSLTKKQKNVYFIIETFIKDNGISPTVREIAEILGERTPAAVLGILNRLEQKGVIKRIAGSARSIQLLTENSSYGAPAYLPVVKKLDARTVLDITNLYNLDKHQPFPEDYLQGSKDVFLISCTDNSLRDMGINYQDLLVISRDCEIKDGDIVLAMYKNHTLVRRHFSTTNPDKLTLRGDTYSIDRDNFEKSEVEIAGRLIGKYTIY